MASGTITLGRRIYPDAAGQITSGLEEGGCYARHSDGTWWARLPTAEAWGLLSGLGVIEHLDGTISLPDLICAEHWSGWLTFGVWRQK